MNDYNDYAGINHQLPTWDQAKVYWRGKGFVLETRGGIYGAKQHHIRPRGKAGFCNVYFTGYHKVAILEMTRLMMQADTRALS